MFWSLRYLALRCLLQIMLLPPKSDGFKELESVVLRHQLAVLRRQAGRPQLRPTDRPARTEQPPLRRRLLTRPETTRTPRRPYPRIQLRSVTDFPNPTDRIRSVDGPERRLNGLHALYMAAVAATPRVIHLSLVTSGDLRDPSALRVGAVEDRSFVSRP